MRALIEKVIEQALFEAKSRNVPIYTFALYYDHESPAVSVCIDTEEQSKATVKSMNTYSRIYFGRAVADGDLSGAALWRANIGRSLSLGDFHMVNVARTELAGDFVPGDDFFLALVQALVAAEAKVSAQSGNTESLLLCCSGKDDEVALWWSVA